VQERPSGRRLSGRVELTLPILPTAAVSQLRCAGARSLYLRLIAALGANRRSKSNKSNRAKGQDSPAREEVPN
jgi:hypothetical protein